jgi:hypothetical protein
MQIQFDGNSAPMSPLQHQRWCKLLQTASNAFAFFHRRLRPGGILFTTTASGKSGHSAVRALASNGSNVALLEKPRRPMMRRFTKLPRASSTTQSCRCLAKCKLKKGRSKPLEKILPNPLTNY